jgi:hypothetical protein
VWDPSLIEAMNGIHEPVSVKLGLWIIEFFDEQSEEVRGE